MLKEFPVDAGMIGIVPLAAVNRGDGCWLEGGLVVTVRGGQYLDLRYDSGRIAITTSGTAGSVWVEKDEQYWVGDLCYALEHNIPDDEPEWPKAVDVARGYWAACVSSFETPREGRYVARPFPIDEERVGLVSRTKWGDGLYPGDIKADDGYLLNVVVETGDDWEEEEEDSWD
jgi:hypothetical protein